MCGGLANLRPPPDNVGIACWCRVVCSGICRVPEWWLRLWLLVQFVRVQLFGVQVYGELLGCFLLI